MQLSEFFANLSYGKLSGLSIGDEGSGVIPSDQENRLISFTNQGLTQLFTRFVLSEKEVIIRAYDEQTFYPLEKRYADTDPTVVERKFISDTESDPFLEDILKILTVYDEEGCELPLNDPRDVNSLYNPSPKILQIPQPATGNAYWVFYQASHPKLVPDDLDQAIDLHPVLYTALESYVSYLVFSGMNGQEHTAKASEHLSTYESILQETLLNDSLGTSQIEASSKFLDRGFA